MQKKLSHPKNSRRPSRATNSPGVRDVIVSWYSPLHPTLDGMQTLIVEVRHDQVL